MLRRELLLALGAAPFLSAAEALPVSFGLDDVARIARDRAARPFEPPFRDLPPALRGLDYDAYRAIRFRPDHALWRDRGLPFEAEFFHRGYDFPERVEMFEIAGGRASPIPYDPAAFASDRLSLSGLPADLGFAGLRLEAPINRPDLFDEIAVFQGASYFRSLGRDQAYGLSARGLAINAGGPATEEFPAFRRFWIERPAPGADAVRVYGLMDSPSVAGAFSFLIRPGAATVFDVEARLIPRVELADAGIAPATSMFLFGPGSPRRFDDVRPAVHDSDGLQIFNGRGERLWRPLTNPRMLQDSAFQDEGPHGFGLIQRARAFGDYQDAEARYDRRPSLWIEPLDDWGPGAVRLIELPAALEREDNIVAFWQPRDPLAAGQERVFRYRMSWGPPPSAGDLAEVRATRTGLKVDETRAASEGPSQVRTFSLDFTRAPGVETTARLWSSTGRMSPPRIADGAPSGGPRLDFEFDPMGASVADLRAELTGGGKPLSESWMYRWTA